MEEKTQQKTFVVTLKGAGPWISELHYEKEEQDLKLYFTLKKEVEVNVIVQDQKAQDKEAGEKLPLGLLAKRIVQGVEYKPGSDLYISLLSKHDFQECRATPKMLGQVLKEIKGFAGENSSLVVMFEALALPESQGVLWSKNAAMRQKLLSARQGKERGNWVLFQGKGLEELKATVQSLL